MYSSKVISPSVHSFKSQFIVPIIPLYMKLSKKDIVSIQDGSPLELFGQGIKSEATLDKYTRTLRQITCHILDRK